jgi:hypothetical protein
LCLSAFDFALFPILFTFRKKSFGICIICIERIAKKTILHV